VKFLMAVSAECYEIILFVVPKEASKLNVMYLKVPQATAMLATPTVSVQNLIPECFV